MVAWCCANYLAFDTLGLSFSLSHSLSKLVCRDKSRMLRVRSPVTCHTSHIPRIFRIVREIIVDTELPMTLCNDRQEPSRESEREQISIYLRIPPHRLEESPASGGESNMPCENIHDTDWQVFPRARENRSRNSRASLSPRSTGWYTVA